MEKTIHHEGTIRHRLSSDGKFALKAHCRKCEVVVVVEKWTPTIDIKELLMNNWIKNNWDKLIGFIVSIIIAGIIGFFSAVRATEKQISDLRSRSVVLETDSKNLIKPKLDIVDTIKLDLERIRERLDSLEKENDIYKATNNLIDLKREEEKRRTINELQEILKP